VPPTQRFGVRAPVGGLERLGQVVEVNGDVGMVGPEARFIDDQRPAIKRLRLRVVGENSRNGILCTPSVNPPRQQRMLFRRRSVIYGKLFHRAFTREKRCLTCVNFRFLSSSLIVCSENRCTA
jgi:hypothetical protein